MDLCGLENTCIECYWMYLSCFKYIRNVYDSVKFLSDVMSFISALGVLAVSHRSDQSEGTGLTCPSACWLVWTGLTGLWKRHCSLCLHVCAIWHIASRIYLCCSHTLVTPHGCWDLGGVSFVINMCILACEANLWWIPFICTYWGGAPTKSENSKKLLNIFL